jgi:hypothetical protein
MSRYNKIINALMLHKYLLIEGLAPFTHRYFETKPIQAMSPKLHYERISERGMTTTYLNKFFMTTVQTLPILSDPSPFAGVIDQSCQGRC